MCGAWLSTRDAASRGGAGADGRRATRSGVRGRRAWGADVGEIARRVTRDVRRRGGMDRDRDRWERGGLGGGCRAREELTERALVGMDGPAGLRRGRLDMRARRGHTLTLEARVGDQRGDGQREVQHRPDHREDPPRRASTHGCNVDGASRAGNVAGGRRGPRGARTTRDLRAHSEADQGDSGL